MLCFFAVGTLQRVLPDGLHEVADLVQLSGDADVLRTVRLTLATADAVVGLA